MQFKELERENVRLKKLVADLSLDNAILKRTPRETSKPGEAEEGWCVNHKRIERLWPCEGLKVPSRQPKRRRLWLNDGSCVRLWPRYRNHLWSYDFVTTRTHDGKPVRTLTLIDEYSRECLAIDVARRLNHENVLDRLADLFVYRGVTDYMRSGNGSEFSAVALRDWLDRLYVKTAYIEPGSPWRRDTSSHSTENCGMSF